MPSPIVKNTTIKEIALRVKRQRDNNNSNTAILIGAGCSVSAGIPICEGMMKEMEAQFTELLTSCDKTYQTYMERLTASERKIFLDNYINNAKLNLSHIFLASLVREKYVDCILTTNFDNLALKALTTLNQFPAVYDLASSSDYIPGSFTYPSIIYLHGQHTGLWQMNTPEEMESVKNSIARAFDEIIAHRTLIVVGYGGNDPVLDVLKHIPRFNDNAYWVGYKSEQPDKHIQEAMFNNGRKGIYYLPNYDSDKFFYDLHNELGLESPTLFSKPFLHLEETYQLVSEKLILNEEPYDITGFARDIIKQAEGCVINIKYSGSNVNDLTTNKQDITTIALASWMGWRKNDPDNFYEIIFNSNNIPAKEFLSFAYIEKGNSSHTAKEYKSAIECYHKSTLLKPDSPIAFNNWGISLSLLASSLGNDESLYKEAIEKYDRATKLKPDYFDAYYNWGFVLDGLGRSKNNDEVFLNQAIEKYKKATNINLHHYQSYNNWGASLADIARSKNNDIELLNQAIDKYKKAISIKNDYYESYFNWGNALVILSEASKDNKEGLLNQAFEKYEIATKIKPDLYQVYINWCISLRGLAMSKSNNEAIYRKSIFVSETGIRYNPESLIYYQNINYCLLRILDATESKSEREKLLQQIIANTQQANEVKLFVESYNLACAYSIMGKTKDALRELELALANNTVGENRQFIETEDPDMKNLRGLPEFTALLDKYMPISPIQ